MTISDEQLPAASRLRAPDFFLVGHSKSGTTALYEMLRRHSQIHMPDTKEPWFFSTDAWPRFRPRMAGVGPQTLEDYLSLFSAAQPGQRVGEASSSYLWSAVAAKQIAKLAPAARIIAILREPASFLHSLHLQLVQDHIEWEKDFRRAISLEPQRRLGKHVPRRSHRPQMLLYSEYVRYVEQLRRYYAVFPAEQVLVLIYDDFKADNAASVRTVLRFLEVDDEQPIEVKQVNPTVRTRSLALEQMVHAVTVGRGPLSRTVNAGVKAFTPRELRHHALGLTLGRVVRAAPRAPDEHFMLELRRRFKGEVQALSEFLGRDLVRLWAYEDIE